MALKEVSQPATPRRFSISLRWLMILGFGGLVTLSVGLVLFMSVAANFANTFSLLNTQALSLLDGMERSIRSETDQAERTVRALAKLYEEGNLKIGRLEEPESQSQQAILKSLMVASPVVEALLIYDWQGWRSGIFRTPEGKFGPIPFGLGNKKELTALLTTDASGEAKRPVWAEPIVINKVLFHSVGFPLEEDGKIVGVAVAAIGQNTMNRIITSLGRDNDTTAFVLTADNKVIAHSRMPEFFKDRESVKLDEFPDEPLKQLATAEKLGDFGKTSVQNMNAYESGRGIGRSGYVFFIRKLEGYSSRPYRLGAYFGKAEIGTEIRHAMGSAIAGLGALALAVLASFFLSRHLSKPMHRISKVANDFSNLKLDNFTPLPATRIREIDEQSKAMNSMHTALTEFSHYVPRTLVKRLMAPGSEATRSVERQITIFFADIVGFTSMSEGLNAVDTAALLNFHFDMVGREITKHNGTVDKFIGDGLMAFWGAPDADYNQAANALSAASGIIKALKQNNLKRRDAGLPPIRLRFGIHTGRVIVGNIGSSERHNYTIVGDAVNVAHRLEQFGKQYIGDAQAIVMVSDVTWQAAGKPSNMHSLGMQKLRGREALIKVFAMGDGIETQTAMPGRRDAG